MTSQNGRDRLGRVECLGWGLMYGVLAALPVFGLICFLETTRPANIHSIGLVSTEFQICSDGDARTAALPLRKYAVAQLRGVSAELSQAGDSASDAKPFSASDAQLAFGGAALASLKPGLRTEFVTKDHRRVAIRIVQRKAITDQAVPDNTRLMNIVPASTANKVSFVWGSWVYVAEVEDKGIEPDLAVQEVL